MSKNQSSLFDQFDTNKWQSSSLNMEDFLNRPLALFEVEHAQGINGPARKLHFIDMDSEETHIVTTGSRFLLNMADDFVKSDVNILPIRVSRVRQAFSVELDTTVDLERAAAILKD